MLCILQIEHKYCREVVNLVHDRLIAALAMHMLCKEIFSIPLLPYEDRSSSVSRYEQCNEPNSG